MAQEPSGPHRRAEAVLDKLRKARAAGPSGHDQGDQREPVAVDELVDLRQHAEVRESLTRSSQKAATSLPMSSRTGWPAATPSSKKSTIPESRGPSGKSIVPTLKKYL